MLLCEIMSITIGVDFDNTIVSYDDLFYEIALERNLIPAKTPRKKNIIRDVVRSTLSGEVRWQELQSIAYGSEMSHAKLIPFVDEFFSWCHQTSTQVYIVSHKTLDFRDSALSWIQKNKVFANNNLTNKIYFELTRIEKIERICNLGCTHFIDDLEEVFIEPDFPKNVRKILFTEKFLTNTPTANSKATLITYDLVTSSWKEIGHYFSGR